MPKSPLTDKMKDRAPKFGDEGEPDESSPGQATEADPGDDPGDAGPPDMPGAPTPGGSPGGAPPGMDPMMAKAVDDMGDVLGIGPEDRADFAMALQAFVSASMAQNMGPPPGPDMGGGPPMPPDAGDAGPPEEDEEEPQ